ncbi:MAG: dihydrofolate reductase family protein [Actinobacteria bacterium]|nr:dihydrofolate reductase family protein [Actinomycetota bacterium]
MRKIVFGMTVSLDGFMEGPGHDLGWHAISHDVHQYFNDLLRPMSAFVDGRRTWQLMADYWPTADDDPSEPEVVKEFAGIWRDKQKFVYSRTLDESALAWNTTLVREVDPNQVRELKEQPGGDIALGGAELGAAFMAHDLIDEYSVNVVPIVLGAGTPMFKPLDHRIELEHVETRTFDNGLVVLRYERPRG